MQKLVEAFCRMRTLCLSCAYLLLESLVHQEFLSSSFRFCVVVSRFFLEPFPLWADSFETQEPRLMNLFFPGIEFCVRFPSTLKSMYFLLEVCVSLLVESVSLSSGSLESFLFESRVGKFLVWVHQLSQCTLHLLVLLTKIFFLCQNLNSVFDQEDSENQPLSKFTLHSSQAMLLLQMKLLLLCWRSSLHHRPFSFLQVLIWRRVCCIVSVVPTFLRILSRHFFEQETTSHFQDTNRDLTHIHAIFYPTNIYRFIEIRRKIKFWKEGCIGIIQVSNQLNHHKEFVQVSTRLATFPDKPIIDRFFSSSTSSTLSHSHSDLTSNSCHSLESSACVR